MGIVARVHVLLGNSMLNKLLYVLVPLGFVVIIAMMMTAQPNNYHYQPTSPVVREPPTETKSTFEGLLDYEPLACDKAYHKATDCEYVLSGKSTITRDEVCLSQEIKMQLYPRYGEKCIQAHIDVYNCMANVQSCFNYGQEMLNRCDSALAKANAACGNNL